MNVQNLADTLQVLNLLPVAAVTASGNGTGVDLLSYTGDIKIVQDISAPVAGTNPTFDGTLEESDDNSSFTAISGGAFTQVTDTAGVQSINLNKDALKRYIRFVKTIGGTMSPQYLVSVKAYTTKKYPA